MYAWSRHLQNLWSAVLTIPSWSKESQWTIPHLCPCNCSILLFCTRTHILPIRTPNLILTRLRIFSLVYMHILAKTSFASYMA